MLTYKYKGDIMKNKNKVNNKSKKTSNTKEKNEEFMLNDLEIETGSIYTDFKEIDLDPDYIKKILEKDKN